MMVRVAEGRFAGMEYDLEGPIADMMGTSNLAQLAAQGNPAGLLAIREYNVDDEPFYYGKIGALGHILSHKDIYGEPPEYPDDFLEET
jgi:hypothetical protein